MGVIESFSELIKDPVRGPKFLVSLSIFTFLWIGFMQAIDADLWYNHNYGRSAVLIEEMK